MIYGRPELTKDMGCTRFLEFYYLETEMSDFCKKNGLDPLGGRSELKERIASFLSGGKYTQSKFIIKPEEEEKNDEPSRGIFDGYSYSEDFEYDDDYDDYDDYGESDDSDNYGDSDDYHDGSGMGKADEIGGK